MDLFTALKSKKSRFTTWKEIYTEIVSHISPMDKKDNKYNETKIDWYEKCMNTNIKKKILPIIKNRDGTNFVYTISLLKEKFVQDHIENYIRMFAMATLYHATCDPSQNMYVSNYDHDTDVVTIYPIEELLMAAFFGIEIRGILFNERLNKEIIAKGYDKEITEEELVKKLFNPVMYSKLFGIPHQDIDSEYMDEIISDNKKSKENGKNKRINEKKTKKKEELEYNPCCKYSINVAAHIVETCSEDITEGSHHCFGCGIDYVEKQEKKIILHSQMFDFNKFILSMEKIKEGKYKITFDVNQNQPYKHASYVSAGRGEVIGKIEETIAGESICNGMTIVISKKKDSYEAKVNYIGIDWF